MSISSYDSFDPISDGADDSTDLHISKARTQFHHDPAASLAAATMNVAKGDWHGKYAKQAASYYHHQTTRFSRSRPVSLTQQSTFFKHPQLTAANLATLPTRSQSPPSIPLNQQFENVTQTNSIAMPTQTVTGLVSPPRRDATPAFTKASKSRSRFTASSPMATLPEQAADLSHNIIDGDSLATQEEKAIYASLQLLKSRVEQLEMDKAESEKRSEEYESEIIDLRSQLTVIHTRPDSALGSEADFDGENQWQSQKAALEASLTALQTRLKRSERKASVSDIAVKRIVKERNELDTELKVVNTTVGDLQIENSELKDNNAYLQEEYEELNDEAEALRKQNEELRQLVLRARATHNGDYDKLNDETQALRKQNEELRQIILQERAAHEGYILQREQKQAEIISKLVKRVQNQKENLKATTPCSHVTDKDDSQTRPDGVVKGRNKGSPAPSPQPTVHTHAAAADQDKSLILPEPIIRSRKEVKGAPRPKRAHRPKSAESDSMTRRLASYLARQIDQDREDTPTSAPGPNEDRESSAVGQEYPRTHSRTKSAPVQPSAQPKPSFPSVVVTAATHSGSSKSGSDAASEAESTGQLDYSQQSTTSVQEPVAPKATRPRTATPSEGDAKDFSSLSYVDPKQLPSARLQKSNQAAKKSTAPELATRPRTATPSEGEAKDLSALSWQGPVPNLDKVVPRTRPRAFPPPEDDNVDNSVIHTDSKQRLDLSSVIESASKPDLDLPVPKSRRHRPVPLKHDILNVSSVTQEAPKTRDAPKQDRSQTASPPPEDSQYLSSLIHQAQKQRRLRTASPREDDSQDLSSIIQKAPKQARPRTASLCEDESQDPSVIHTAPEEAPAVAAQKRKRSANSHEDYSQDLSFLSSNHDFNLPKPSPLKNVITPTQSEAEAMLDAQDDTMDSFMNGSIDGPDGSFDGSWAGGIDGPDGSFDGSMDGSVHGTVEGKDDGATQDHADEVMEGSVDGAIDGNADGTLDGSIDGKKAEGRLDGTKDDTVESAVELTWNSHHDPQMTDACRDKLEKDMRAGKRLSREELRAKIKSYDDTLQFIKSRLESGEVRPDIREALLTRGMKVQLPPKESVRESSQPRDDDNRHSSATSDKTVIHCKVEDKKRAPSPHASNQHRKAPRQTKPSDASAASNTSRRRHRAESADGLTSAYIVPDITLKDSAVQSRVKESSTPRDTSNCSSRPSSYQKVRVSSPMAVSEPEEDVDATDVTIRPSQPPAVALASVIKQLEEEIVQLKTKLSAQQRLYNQHDASISKRRRQDVRVMMDKYTNEVEKRSDQVYALYDVLEGQRQAEAKAAAYAKRKGRRHTPTEMTQEDVDATLSSIGMGEAEICGRIGRAGEDDTISDIDDPSMRNEAWHL